MALCCEFIGGPASVFPGEGLHLYGPIPESLEAGDAAKLIGGFGLSLLGVSAAAVFFPVGCDDVFDAVGDDGWDLTAL